MSTAVSFYCYLAYFIRTCRDLTRPIKKTISYDWPSMYNINCGGHKYEWYYYSSIIVQVLLSNDAWETVLVTAGISFVHVRIYYW